MFNYPYSYNPQPAPLWIDRPAQQAPAQPQISGRVVTSLEDIAINEIPDNRSVAYFPTLDGSKIYARSWNTDGTIDTKVFELAEQQPGDKPITPPVDLSPILDRLDRIEGTLLNGHPEFRPEPDTARSLGSEQPSQPGSYQSNPEYGQR